MSLFEIVGLMERFHAEDLADLSYNLGQFYVLMRLIQFDIDTPAGFAITTDTPEGDDFDRLRSQLKRLGCDVSVIALDRMKEYAERGAQDKDAFARQHTYQNDFVRRLQDELVTTVFLSLGMWEASLYESPLEGWEDVVDAFPDTAFEITEASKCHALNRDTATVFHILRAVEIGILALLKSIGNTTKSGNWGKYIEVVETYARTTPLPSNKDALEDVAAHLRTVKNAWRNPTMHVDKIYTPATALEIYNASKGLLRSIIKVI